MPLDFPSSPVDGQVYDNWVYSSAKGAWLAKPLEPATAVTSDTAPPNPIDGDMWYNTNDGTTYVWYDDGNSAQWVEMVAPVTASGYLSPNYVINGGFDINQRGFTSVTNSAIYGFDRWSFNQQGGGTSVFSAQTFTVGEAPFTKYAARNFFRAVSSGYSATNSVTNLTHPIEDVRTLSDSTITVSFWAKAGSGTPKVSIEMQQNFGTGGSTIILINAGAVTLSTSWQRYSLTVALPSISGKTIGINHSLNTVFWFNAGTDFASRTNSIGVQNNTFDIWGVQVEEGSVATPFRRSGNTIQEELANCQRYYQRWNAASVGSRPSSGLVSTATTAALDLQLGVDFRAVPALEYSGNADWTLLNAGVTPTITGLTISGAATNRSGSMNVTVSGGLTLGHAASLRAGTATAWIALNAEL